MRRSPKAETAGWRCWVGAGDAIGATESAAACFATQLRHAEQALQDRRAFLVGGRLTTADMLLTTCLAWAVSYRVPITPACHPISRGSPFVWATAPAWPPISEHVMGAQLAAFCFATRRAAGRSVSSGRCRGSFALGPGRRWTCFGESGSPHSEHTITGSKSLPQRS